MSRKIVILGAGPGGYVAAVRAAQLGAEVTIVEADNVGGTCLNWGCIPSKVMITTANLLESFRRAGEYGVQVDGDARLDIAALMARKRAVVQAQAKGILGLLRHHRVQYINGFGRLKGPGLAVVRTEGGEEEIPWDRLILATGTQPFELPSLPFDGERILSSNHALNLKSVPETVLIVGGGVIGCEFAFLLSALGAEVIVVEALPRLLPLPSVDESCSKVLQREMKKRKIGFFTNRTADAFEEDGHRLRVTLGSSPFLKNPSGREKEPVTVAVDRVLVCIGRKANTDGIGLASMGILTDGKGWIPVDERMETAAPGVYAIGDVLGPSKVMLAHVASTEGIVAAENAMGGRRSMDYSVVPGAIFTSPEVANVGQSESQARRKGRNVRADSVLFRNLGKAQVVGEIAGEAKIVSDAGTGEILGVHIVGPHATDLIAEAALAMRMGASVRDIAETIHAHPTLAEINMECALKAMDRALHG